MAKGGLQRQRFQEKQRHNRIVAELENLYQQGYSVEEVRGMGNKAGNYVVTDKDTIASIAEKNKLGVNDILNANPDMTAPKTGMVVNIPGSEQWRKRNTLAGAGGIGSSAPLPGSEQWRTQNIRGGIGLPSAGPLGVAPGGLSIKPGQQGIATNGQYLKSVNFGPAIANAYNSIRELGSSTTPRYYGRGLGQPTSNPSQPYSQPQSVNFGPAIQGALNTGNPSYRGTGFGPPPATTVTAPQAPRAPQTQPAAAPAAAPVRGMPVYNTANLAGAQAYRITELHNAINAGKKPTEAQLDYLIKRGLIAKKGIGAGGFGGGTYRRFGGGGGGSGRGTRGQGGYQQSEPRLPAFSNNSGFSGLVNWRI